MTSASTYMASAGDLMVGLLFLSLLSLAALGLDAPGAAPPRAQADRPAAPAPTPGLAGPSAREALGAREQAIRDIQVELRERGVIVHVDAENGIIRLPEELLFEVGHADMRPGAEVAIARIANELTYFLPHCPLLDGVVVEGHTDDRPIAAPIQDAVGTHRDNWDLAYHRAKRTFQGLIAAAPSLGRMRNDRELPVLAMAAFGPARPVASNATANGRQLNRRIDLRLILTAPRAVPMERPR